jgi:hypothetical protein
MDRGEEVGNGGIERINRRRVGQVDIRCEPDPGMAAEGEVVGRAAMAGRHVAGRAAVEQPLQHRPAQRAGAAGHHDLPSLKHASHEASGSRYCRLVYSTIISMR